MPPASSLATAGLQLRSGQRGPSQLMPACRHFGYPLNSRKRLRIGMSLSAFERQMLTALYKLSDRAGCCSADSRHSWPSSQTRKNRGRHHGDADRGSAWRAAGAHHVGRRDYRQVVMPPSTYSVCPLTKDEASPERKTAAPISSSTLPQRPAGVRFSSQAEKAASSTSA